MRTIREILLPEYIILVAVLIADAFTALISTAAAQITYYLQFARLSAFPDPHKLSTTYPVSGALTRIALLLISAYLIARWLYPAEPTQSPRTPQERI